MTKHAWASTTGLTFASRRISRGCFSSGVHIKLVFPFHIFLVLFELLKIRSKGTPVLSVDPHPEVDLQHTGRRQLYRPGGCNCSRHEVYCAFKCRIAEASAWAWFIKACRMSSECAMVSSIIMDGLCLLLRLLSTGSTYMKGLGSGWWCSSGNRALFMRRQCQAA